MVAISHRYKFIYIKTTKTGGTSVEMFLEPLCTPPGHIVQHATPTIETEFGVIGRRGPPTFSFFRYLDRARKWYNHMPARKVRCRVGAETFDNYIKVAAIRNPYDFLISLYYQEKRSRKKVIPSDLSVARKEFLEFARRNWNDQTNMLTISKKLCIDRFIRMEYMALDLERFVRDIGVYSDSLLLSHVKQNTKRSRNLADYYDKESAARVRDRMGWVFDRCNYPSEIPGL